MRQERKEVKGKFRKFEDGVLRVDACMERYSTSRDSQYRTWQEDLPSYSFGSSALRQERWLMRDVYQLSSLGLRPSGLESLEEFVERHRDTLEEVV